MISQIFTWWHRQTLGTFFKTFFTGKLVGKDQFGNKYYQNKRNERWVIYAAEIDASKITSEWFMWIHHTTDKPPVKNKKPYFWQKKHLENLTGTENAYKPSKIQKDDNFKKYNVWKE